MSTTFEKVIGLDEFKDYSYGSRGTCPVYLPSGDPYIFYIEQCPDGSVLNYDVQKTIGGAVTTALQVGYTGEEIPSGLRVIAGTHIKRQKEPDPNAPEPTPEEQEELDKEKKKLTKTKWVGYRTIEDPSKVVPFFEAYSISVSYKKNINKLDLFFWTNVLSTSDKSYDIKNIAIQKSPGNFISNEGAAITGDSIVKQLFHAEGSFIKCGVNAEIISGEKDSDFPVEYVPIFNTPVSLQVYTKRDAAISDYSLENSAFPYGDKWAFGLMITNSTIRIYNPLAQRQGVMTNNWLTLVPEEGGGIPDKVYLEVAWNKDSFAVTGEQGRFIVYYLYDTAGNTEEVKTAKTLSEASTLPTNDGAGLLDPLRFYKVPLYTIIGQKGSDGEFSQIRMWQDFIHGMYVPQIM